MPVIELQTVINADIERCFDLSTSIDVHKLSTAKTNEEAIAGVTSGFIKLNETVTWRATHLGVRQNLTTKITAYDRPYHFCDEQIKGAFKSLKHDHYFESQGSKTIMRDVFIFESPMGVAGRIFNALVLKKYLKKFLEQRNQMIKEVAEQQG